MRLGSLILLTALSAPSATYAEEVIPTTPENRPTATVQVAASGATSNQAPSELEAQLQSQAVEQDALLEAERQANQRLKQQLKQALENSAPPPLFTEQQTWFAIGVGSALLSVLIGALLRGTRRTRREWLN